MTHTDADKSIFDPYYQITTVREMFLFTLGICDILNKGEISVSRLNEEFFADNVIRVKPRWKPNTIPHFTHNLTFCVLGNCFIVIDEALNRIFGNKPRTYLNNDIDALRGIIYMFRCAIAHGPATPVWNVKNKYRKSFRINEIGYELDLTESDGRPLRSSHYGGLAGAITLINHSLEIVKRYSNKAKIY